MFGLTRETEETWDTIAESFDVTRRKPWQICLDFIDRLDSNSIVADLGCGNGRHLLPCAERFKRVVGVDISRNLLKITLGKVRSKGFENVLLLQSDLAELPIKDNSFDGALFIASLHNIRGRNRRINSLKELRRVLKKNGIALVSVWSRWQDRFANRFLVDLFLFPFRYIRSHGKYEFGDIEIFWRQHNLNVKRFYHLYSKRELLKDVKKAGLRIIEIKDVKLKSKKRPDNFFVIVRK